MDDSTGCYCAARELWRYGLGTYCTVLYPGSELDLPDGPFRRMLGGGLMSCAAPPMRMHVGREMGCTCMGGEIYLGACTLYGEFT
jgi:hypothetical protein